MYVKIFLIFLLLYVGQAENMKAEILISLLFDLLAEKRLSAPQIARRYGVSTRTALRYIDTLTLAGVPVVAIRGQNGGFAVLDTYKLPAGFLTEEEHEAVTEALSAVNAQLGSAKLASGIKKLLATSKNTDNSLRFTSGNLIIDAGHWGDTGMYKKKLSFAERCIEENKVMFIRYHDRTGETSERSVEPHALLFKQGLWYIYAYCRLRGAFRFFKLGRIEQAKATEETFARREMPKADFTAWYGAGQSVPARFEIEKSALSDFEEWVGIENIREINGVYIAEVSLPDDGGLVSKILTFGTGIKVLSPPELKKKVVDAAKAVAEYYDRA